MKPSRAFVRIARKGCWTAECGDLDLIRQDFQEQPTRQMGGRGPAQMIAPLQSKPICVEIGQARDHVLDRPCVVRSRRPRRRRLADAARKSAHRHHAARRALGFASRRILFESDSTSERAAAPGRTRFDAVDRSAPFVRPIDCRREAALAQAGQRCACRVRKPPRHFDQFVNRRALIPLKQFDDLRQLRPASRRG